MKIRRFLSFTALAFLWTGSQLPVYLFGVILPYVYGDIGGVDKWVWFILGNLLSLAGVCPFAGSLSDLIGRRYVALVGASLVSIGMIVSSTASTMNAFIALAATAELAPTRKRGKYVAILISTILPFCPSVLWAQLNAYHSSWRYVGALSATWNGLGLIMTILFYFPPPRINSRGLQKSEIISQIYFIGGILSISGLVCFLAGLQWGGCQASFYSWSSAHVHIPLVLGTILLLTFAIWEVYGTKHPIFPSRIIQEPRVFGLPLLITFISGANFFSVIMFWPTQAFNVYSHDPVEMGVRSLPIGIGILAGAFITLRLLSLSKGRIRELMIGSTSLMAAGCGAMSISRPHNLYQMWGILLIAALGIGGIVVPASIMMTIVCPDDLVATVSALTLSIRVVGGGVGYAIYYNILIKKFVPNAQYYIGGVMNEKLNITSIPAITAAIQLTGASLLDGLRQIPEIAGSELVYDVVVAAGQIAYAESYQWVYYVSIAFGGLAFLASFGLKNISKYMDEHVAVVMN
ncbi:major facilitator superfamily domain-containing protein [Talaromyces proteolyticus]|uniref:Major facilitator superfamily domain-containing protein n=1 Tax=Talaromyces proteolyticus TaxID=1131652 RepID=A0AAD4KSW3_9EURO|nr:major facilitator superfamily domain-containing protein [Talaromyces proteolyticus]KAH8697978.1 major facilitator superfamily domain-containing protein [Talaromyces proteolyticus]